MAAGSTTRSALDVTASVSAGCMPASPLRRKQDMDEVFYTWKIEKGESGFKIQKESDHEYTEHYFTDWQDARSWLNEEFDDLALH